MVKSGTVASRMEATPESMDFCPQEMRKNGMAMLVSPRMMSGVHSFRVRGRGMRRMKMTAAPNKNPKKTRNATRVMGPTSRSASSTHIKDELQIKPSVIKTIQCFVFKVTPFLYTNKNSIRHTALFATRFLLFSVEPGSNSFADM